MASKRSAYRARFRNNRAPASTIRRSRFGDSGRSRALRSPPGRSVRRNASNKVSGDLRRTVGPSHANGGSRSAFRSQSRGDDSRGQSGRSGPRRGLVLLQRQRFSIRRCHRRSCANVQNRWLELHFRCRKSADRQGQPSAHGGTMEAGRTVRVSDRRAFRFSPPPDLSNLFSGCAQRAAPRISIGDGSDGAKSGSRDTLRCNILECHRRSRVTGAGAQTRGGNGDALGVFLSLATAGSVNKPRDRYATIRPQFAAVPTAPCRMGDAAPSSNHSIHGNRTAVNESSRPAGDDL